MMRRIPKSRVEGRLKYIKVSLKYFVDTYSLVNMIYIIYVVIYYTYLGSYLDTWFSNVQYVSRPH